MALPKRPAPFVLIPDNLSHDTVECLRELLQQAEKGELVGIAYAAMVRRRGFVVNTAGEAHNSPTFTRGMVAALDDQLSGRVASRLTP